MIEMLDIGIKNTVAYRVGGKVTEDEMKSVSIDDKDTALEFLRSGEL